MFDNIDIYQVKLNSRSVGESLCNLERQVNTAVLRLVLEVFTGINCPLKNIVNKCKTDIQKDNKVTEDLNVLISEFDKEMDKIMQIGLFAISCTSDSSSKFGEILTGTFNRSPHSPIKLLTIIFVLFKEF